MKPYGKYVDELRSLLSELRRTRRPDVAANTAILDQVDAALDGGASRALRELVDISWLREQGAFFTGSALSARVARAIAPTFKADSVVLDPACGAGDLLLACARLLPRAKRREDRLRRLSAQLIGRDLNPHFVEAARLRLGLFACHAGLTSSAATFRQVKVACGLQDVGAIRAATHIILNPPFTLKAAPADCEWAAGLISSAALFVAKIVEEAAAGTRIVAILPDVLRSGPRYRKWRKRIGQKCSVEYVGLGGLFDAQTDVNIFLVHLKVRSGDPRSVRANAWKSPRRSSRTVEDRFTVSVGSVVDYRDPHSGGWQKFIRSESLKPWSTLSSIRGSRRFAGRVVSGPFVAVKRTSRPGDKHRAVGAIVNSREPVAVENHVLVLQPKDGSIQTCRKLLAVLRNRRTTEHLNQRIRCRHLTVGSLRELPWGKP